MSALSPTRHQEQTFTRSSRQLGDVQRSRCAVVAVVAHGGDEQSFSKFVGIRRWVGPQRFGLWRASDGLGRLRFCDFCVVSLPFVIFGFGGFFRVFAFRAVFASLVLFALLRYWPIADMA